MSRSSRRRFSRQTLAGLLAVFFALTIPVAIFAPAAFADEDGNDGGGNDNDDGGHDDSGSGDGGGSAETGEGDVNGIQGGGGNHIMAWPGRGWEVAPPLNAIMTIIRRKYGGAILDVKLKRGKNRLWYEIRILDRRDRVRTLRFAARTRKNRRNWSAGNR